MQFLVHQFRSIDLFSTVFFYIDNFFFIQTSKGKSVDFAEKSVFTFKLVNLSTSKVNLLKTNENIAPLRR